MNTECAEHLKQTPSTELEGELRAEADACWSVVGKTSHQRWTWYALDRSSGRISAYQIGKHPDEMCKRLIGMWAIFPIRWSYTDNWQRDAKVIPVSQYRIGKDTTWKIERTNLNVCTHLKCLHRKTICFSKSETIHDNVIGLYINRHAYKGSDGKVA